MIMKHFLILTIFLFEAHALATQPQTRFEKRIADEETLVPLTEADFRNGEKFSNLKEDSDNLQKHYFKRTIVRNKTLLWPNGTIPYWISSYFFPDERAEIDSAIAEFHNRTCIRFIDRTNETDYVFFTKANECQSAVGRQGGCQNVHLMAQGCTQFSTVLHELMHLIGFFHQQQRTDRDKHVTVLYDNIRSDKTQEYDINGAGHRIGAYDLHSITHYNTSAYAINASLPTMQTVNPDQVINPGPTLSNKDIRKINFIYNCTASNIG